MVEREGKTDVVREGEERKRWREREERKRWKERGRRKR